MSDYIVGDIQGCYDGLKRLLKKIAFDPKQDKLFAVGDLIGRGPQALKTLDYLIKLGDSFETVLGNHDLHFLAVTQGIKKARAEDGFDALLKSQDLPRYVNWLRKKPLMLSLPNETYICHAGLFPHWSIKKGLKLSTRISQKLQSDNWSSLLEKMYEPTDNVWSPNLKGSAKDNFIINAFTRMRYVTPNGALELKAKGKPTNTSSSLIPWFNQVNHKLSDSETIIFGHWAALEGETRSEQFIGVDTGFVWGNKLTAYNLRNKQKISINYTK